MRDVERLCQTPRRPPRRHKPSVLWRPCSLTVGPSGVSGAGIGESPGFCNNVDTVTAVRAMQHAAAERRRGANRGDVANGVPRRPSLVSHWTSRNAIDIASSSDSDSDSDKDNDNTSNVDGDGDSGGGGVRSSDRAGDGVVDSRAPAAGSGHDSGHDSDDDDDDAVTAAAAEPSVDTLARHLFAAVEGSNADAVSALIEAGAPATCVSHDHMRWSPLHVASLLGSLPVVDALMSGGADPDAEDMHGDTPLHAASAAGFAAVVARLLQAGATAGRADKDGRTALSVAAARGNTSSVVALLRAGAPIGATDKRGRTALHEAAENGHADAVTELAAAVAEAAGGAARGARLVDARDDGGRTALMSVVRHATEGGDADACRKVATALVRASADVNIADAAGATPLHLARRTHCVAVLAVLERAAAVGAPTATRHAQSVKGGGGAVAGSRTPPRRSQPAQTNVSLSAGASAGAGASPTAATPPRHRSSRAGTPPSGGGHSMRRAASYSHAHRALGSVASGGSANTHSTGHSNPSRREHDNDTLRLALAKAAKEEAGRQAAERQVEELRRSLTGARHTADVARRRATALEAANATLEADLAGARKHTEAAEATAAAAAHAAQELRGSPRGLSPATVINRLRAELAVASARASEAERQATEMRVRLGEALAGGRDRGRHHDDDGPSAAERDLAAMTDLLAREQRKLGAVLATAEGISAARTKLARELDEAQRAVRDEVRRRQVAELHVAELEAALAERPLGTGSSSDASGDGGADSADRTPPATARGADEVAALRSHAAELLTQLQGSSPVAREAAHDGLQEPAPPAGSTPSARSAMASDTPEPTAGLGGLQPGAVELVSRESTLDAALEEGPTTSTAWARVLMLALLAGGITAALSSRPSMPRPR